MVTPAQSTCRYHATHAQTPKPFNRIKTNPPPLKQTLPCHPSQPRLSFRRYGTVPDEIKITEASLKFFRKERMDCLPARERAAGILLLARAGFKDIECGKMDIDLVARLGLKDLEDSVRTTTWKAMGLQGLDLRVKPSAALRLAYTTSASDEFNEKRLGKSFEASLTRLKGLLKLAKRRQMSARVYLSCAFGCPYEGAIALPTAAKRIIRLLALGCDEVYPVDTTGNASPQQIRSLFKILREHAQSSGHPLVLKAHKLGLVLKGNNPEKLDAALESNIYKFESTASEGKGPHTASVISTEAILAHAYRRAIVTGIEYEVFKLAQHKIKQLREFVS